MAYQMIFKRYELKYLLTAQQKDAVIQAIEQYMALDRYGRTTIRNIYFDTENYRLIRRSLEKPVYKEKLRIRSYQKTGKTDTAFVELKKKYHSVVYKRRVSLPLQEAMDWVCGVRPCGPDTQIGAEIDYFLRFYQTLRPSVFLSYEREAYYCADMPDLRITFDENILCRREDLRMDGDIYGQPILPSGKTLMEIKCMGGMPLWLTRVLTREHIYKTSFSKYGTAYQTLIFPNTKQEAFIHGKHF